MSETIIVLDFGGQYKQLIARRVRENHVYCEILPYTTPIEKLKEINPKGIILTGGPDSVYLEDSLSYDPALFSLGIPVLGICYGAQLMAYLLHGEVKTAPVSEYGSTKVSVVKGLGKGNNHMDVPYRLHRFCSRRFPYHSNNTGLSCSSNGE